MSVSNNTIQLENFGPVKELQIPENWIQENTKRNQNALKSFIKYHHPHDTNIQICVHYKGLPVSDNSALLFSKVLESDIENLTTSNLDSLQEILGNLAISQEFKTEESKLVSKNGKRLLQVDGSWVNLSLKSRSYFIDAREDGSIVYELYFASPTEKFDEYWAEVDRSIQSVVWQKV